MHVLGWYKFKCFVYPTSFSFVSLFIDICTVAIKIIRNMDVVSTNQIADVLHFNANADYLTTTKLILKHDVDYVFLQSLIYPCFDKSWFDVWRL